MAFATPVIPVVLSFLTVIHHLICWTARAYPSKLRLRLQFSAACRLWELFSPPQSL
nr:MAG TPA: hypothetical protein [Caudoviricetes sp.]